MKTFLQTVVDFCAEETETGLLLKSKAHYILFEFAVEKDGYYAMELKYFHEDTETLLKGENTYPDGTKTVFFHGLLHGTTHSVINLYLKKGTNLIRLCAPWEEAVICGMDNLGVVQNFKYEISPENVTFFCDAPRTVKVMLKNYRKDLLEIRAKSGVKIPFVVSTKGAEETTASFVDIVLETDAIANLGEGEHTLIYCLDGGIQTQQTLVVKKTTPKTEFKIINFDVGCANSTLLMLPNGKNMLIDSATDDGARDVVIPYLEKHSLNVDYYLLTHFHSDHWGLRDEILDKYGVEKPVQEKADEMVKADKQTREDYLKNFRYLDSTMLCFYDELHNIWDLGGVKIEVLNSRFYENGNPLNVYRYPFVKNNEHNYENSTSVSFMLDYNGFRYYHGADNYAFAQNRIIADFARMGRENELNCHYFFGNHHFICNTSPEFVNTLNPYVVFVPSDISIYCRSTYYRVYKEEIENYYFCDKHLLETLIGGEVGSVRVCVNNADDWYYETIQNDA